MQARGPLMIEHRLIERMIKLLRQCSAAIQAGGTVAVSTLDTYVDFIKFYADRTHHGKEEDILFRSLRSKSLKESDQCLMDELIAEHARGREITGQLVIASNRYRRGDTEALAEIAQCLTTLADFYPKHITKEDEIFFPAVRAYFSEAEEQEMLAEFYTFDRTLIHEKYRSLVQDLEKP